MRGLFRTDSFVVVLEDVLNVGGRVFEVLVVTLGDGALSTLCGGSLLRILVNVVIASVWCIFLLTVDGIAFCSALRR